MADRQSSFWHAAQCFPQPLRMLFDSVPLREQKTAEEIRLRAGKGLSLLGGNGKEQLFADTQWVGQRELQGVIEIATHASFHTAMDKLCRGYLPLPGGNRLGIAGSAVMEQGRIHHFQSISSLSLRIAHSIPGVAEPIARQLERNRCSKSSCLILAPPGHGKTTFLRDLIRIYSDVWQMRVGVADERGEIAALHNGAPQFPIGQLVDVVEGCGKGEGGILLLRSMNPQVIAMDEITSPEDVEALCTIAHCGTAVLATAHAASVEEVLKRPLYQNLFRQQIFQVVIRIQREQEMRSYRLEELPCCI